MKRIGRIGASLRKTRTTQDPIVAALHGHMLKIRLDLGRFLVTMGRTEENRDLDGIIFPRTEGKQDITPENVGLVWEESA